ncbi:MAG TPA: hypothetical protein VLI69_06355 [Gammaproteobacteria bacterium]|nr:hypothetical protein [Gammaproteobacteria bacterium]
MKTLFAFLIIIFGFLFSASCFASCNSCRVQSDCYSCSSSYNTCGSCGTVCEDCACSSCACTEPSCGKNPCLSRRACCQVFGNVGGYDDY